MTKLEYTVVLYPVMYTERKSGPYPTSLLGILKRMRTKQVLPILHEKFSLKLVTCFHNERKNTWKTKNRGAMRKGNTFLKKMEYTFEKPV